MVKRLGVLILATLLFIASFTVPALGTDGITLEQSLHQIVSYYENNKTTLDNWEEVAGLSLAGEDLSADSWQLPDWDIALLDESSYPADYAKTILGMLAADQDPRDADGRDIVTELVGLQDTQNGNFGERLNDTIWSIIALDTAGASYNVSDAVAYLIDKQTSDGGFVLSGNIADPDMTGFALMALAPHMDEEGVVAAVDQAQECMKNMQLDSGGFSSGAENPESIASVIRGLVACKEDITADDWMKNGNTMIDALYAFQLEDYSFAHIAGGSSNAMATRQALIAVADMVNADISYTIGGGNNDPDPEEATVRIRVEGATDELLDKEVTVAGTALEALQAAAGEENVSAPGGFVSKILGESGHTGVVPGTDTGWFYYVIREGEIEASAFNEGPSSYLVEDGDEVIYYIGAYDSTTYANKTYLPVVTVSPATPTVGQSLTISLAAKKYNWQTGLQDLTAAEAAAIGNYTVAVDGNEYTSSNGQVTISNLTQGTLDYMVSTDNDEGYPDVVTYKGSVEVGSNDPVGDNDITVRIAVVGKKGELLYEPDSVQLSEDDEFGLTAMSALEATGLSWSFSDSWDGFIDEIAGEENEGMNGWMYSINEETASDVPMNVSVSAGDKVIFWYSTDPMEDGPTWDDILNSADGTPLGLTEDTEEEIKSILNNYSTELANWRATGSNGLKILNLDKRMSQSVVQDLQAELKENEVDISEEVGSAEVVLADKEVYMWVPEDVLDEDWELTIKELTSHSELKQFAIQAAGSVYEFGPSGTQFDELVTIAIKVPVTEDMNVDKLAVAWYDKSSQQWIPIPGIFDLENGLIIFQTDHFSSFAVINLPDPVINLPDRVSFADVGDDMAWAKDAIEILAGQGIINGTGQGLYEPNRSISRAELVQLVANAMRWETEEYKNGLFNDVNSSDWFAPAVASAYKNKIVAGYPDGTFKSNNSISRNEVAEIFYNMQGTTDSSNEVDLVYKDLANIPAWALNSVKFAHKQGLMKGYEDETFQGNNPLTRAEAAVILYSYLNSISSKSGA